MARTLVIGNKNYSSWSMRPWIALKADRHRLRRGGDPALHRRCRQARHPRLHRRPARCRCWSTATSPSGIRWRSSNTPPSAFPRRGCGRTTSPRARACALGLGRNAFGLRGAAQRMRHEHPPAGRARSRCRRRRWPTSPGSSRSGPTAARATAGPGRICSAPSAAPTRCTRRWCTGSGPMRSNSSRLRRATGSVMKALPAFRRMDRGGARRDPGDREIRGGLNGSPAAPGTSRVPDCRRRSAYLR